MGVNSLPKTVTRQCSGCDLNPGPSESSTLTTRLPIHPHTVRTGGKCWLEGTNVSKFEGEYCQLSYVRSSSS